MQAGRWVGELKFRHFQTGAAIPFLVDWIRLDDPHTGKPMNLATVSRDLTAQKLTEAKLQQLNATLEQQVLDRIDGEQLLRSINAAFDLHVDREQQAIAAARRINTLTPREREVLDGLVAGRQNKVIATQLGISVGYRIRMLERLGTPGLAEAIRLAVIASLAPRDEEPDR
jgi:DNA-binding NarL/FixJ family response regulator